MSSTSSSRVRNGARFSDARHLARLVLAIAPVSRNRRARAHRLVLGLGDEHLAVRPVPRRNLVAPPELARDAPRLDVLHPVEIGLLPVLRHERRSCRRAPPRSPAAPASWRRRTTGRSGTARSPRSERSPCGTMWVCGSILSSSPALSSRSTIVLRASKRSRPCSFSVSSSSGDAGTPSRNASLSLSVELALDVEHVDLRQVVPLADLEVVEVVRRRDLHRAGALLGIGVVVGDDRDAPADQRQDRVSCRSGACSARPPDAPRPRCRPAWSPAAWWRRR